MLPRRYRLRLRKESSFFKEADRLHNNLFTCFYRKGLLKNQQSARIVVLVSKKVSSSAVARNKLKRQWLVELAKEEDLLNQVKLDIALALKPKIVNVGKDEWRKNLKSTLKKLL